MPFLSLLRRVATFAFTLVAIGVQAAETPPSNAKTFDYDANAPLHLHEIGRQTRDGALIRDITFVGIAQPIKAYLVSPAKTTGPVAAILYVHWLGEPATTNRTEFLEEAIALAPRGVVSLLVDTMWAQPDWFGKRVPEEDRENSVRQVIELRHALDLLLSQPSIDPKRVALVGHDFGAMYGAIMGGVDRRISTYVLMAATPRFTDWVVLGPKPKSMDDYRAANGPIDPVNSTARLAPASVFFQFADNDHYVPAAAALELFAAAGAKKQMTVYAAKHDLAPPEVAADRNAWLVRSLALPEK